MVFGIVGYLCFFLRKEHALLHFFNTTNPLNLDSCIKAATLRKRNQRNDNRRENVWIRKRRERELKSKLNTLNELKRRKNQRHKKVAPEKKKERTIGHYWGKQNAKKSSFKKIKIKLAKISYKTSSYDCSQNSPAVKILESIKIVPSSEEKVNLALQDFVFSDIKESVSNWKWKDVTRQEKQWTSLQPLSVENLKVKIKNISC